jgi:acetyl esterase/lipase
MRWLHWVFACVVIAGGSSCAARGGEIVVEENITYGRAGDVDLKLDLARPAEGEGPFPAIVYVHGGGWSGGNRQMHRAHIEEAARRGYVAATISYRLMKYDAQNRDTATAELTFPVQIHDAKTAIRWMRANAKKYHVNPDRIGVGGASAGGHLSLLVGLSDEDDGLEGQGEHADQSSRVQAVVNIFGPTEMASCYENSSVPWIFRLFLDGAPAEQAERYKTASPVTYITQDDPPVLTLHGDKDELVPVQQAQLLDEKLKAAGVKHTLVVLEGQGHGFQGEHNTRATNAMWTFLDENLKK